MPSFAKRNQPCPPPAQPYCRKCYPWPKVSQDCIDTFGTDGSVALPFFGRKPTGSIAPEGKGPSAKGDSFSLPPPPTELSELDFTATEAGRGLVAVEVQEVGAGIGAAYEEAAVLYANGNVAEAEQVLVATLDEPSSNSGEGLWMMLLDLYRLTGKRQQFESRVLDYATRFERSPPPWMDLSASVAKPAQPRPSTVSLAGSLSAQAEARLRQIAVAARRTGSARIDVGRLKGLGDGACGQLRAVLDELAAERIKVTLANVGPLAQELAKRVEAGRAEDRDTWLLLLELLQHSGDQERFENLAIDYAVTFEESPPSWKDLPPPAAPVAATAPVTTPAPQSANEQDGFVLEGELCGASNDALKRFAAYVADRREVAVDCTQLRRLDFVCAGQLFNILATLQAQGKLVGLRNVNAMVAALLRVMSVDQVAHVTLRS